MNLVRFLCHRVYPFNWQAIFIPVVTKVGVTPTAKRVKQECIKYLAFSPHVCTVSCWKFFQKHWHTSSPISSPAPESRKAIKVLLSEFLTIPTPEHETKPATGQARVPTSAPYLRELAEKERKKKKATEEKERRKRT